MGGQNPGQQGVQNQKVIHPNNNFNKCLAAQSNNNGAPPVIQDCNPNSPNQKWIVENNNFKIFGDKTLDDKGGNTTNGAPVQIYTLTGNGNANQMWTYDGFSITLKNTKKCLDNTNGNLNWGNPSQIWDCTGGPNQHWNVNDFPNTNLLISPNINGNVCLAPDSNSDGAAVRLQNCNNGWNQQWTTTPWGDIQIFGNKCLDVTGGNTNPGTNMQIYTCAGNQNQKFVVTADNRIAWKNKGECLDVRNGVTTPGSQVQVWTCTDNNPRQVWNFRP